MIEAETMVTITLTMAVDLTVTTTTQGTKATILPTETRVHMKGMTAQKIIVVVNTRTTIGMTRTTIGMILAIMTIEETIGHTSSSQGGETITNITTEIEGMTTIIEDNTEKETVISIGLPPEIEIETRNLLRRLHHTSHRARRLMAQRPNKGEKIKMLATLSTKLAVSLATIKSWVILETAHLEELSNAKI